MGAGRVYWGQRRHDADTNGLALRDSDVTLTKPSHHVTDRV
jgi:hypothetical protein